MTDVLMRAVPDSFAAALVRGDRPVIDVATARHQHSAYRTLLEDAGYDVRVLPAAEEHPDSPFIEDTCVVLGDVAVMARPGAPSRRGELGPVAQAVAAYRALAAIETPGTLDGGDVLRLGDVLFVGRSSRSNDEGIAQLAAIGSRLRLEVRPVEVTGVLHLKSAVLRIDDEHVLLAPGLVDEAAFAAYHVRHTVPGEEHVASVLALRDGRLMATASAPKTIHMLEQAGYDVVPVDVSQFQAADGGLTCLSLFL